MDDELTAHVSVDIDALADDVWFALTDPAAIARWMSGSRVVTDWRPGSPITWSGRFEGRDYEDRGEVLDASPGTLLRFRHVTPARDDAPERSHVVAIRLEGVDENRTRVVLAQDGNSDVDARRHAERNWTAMLDRLKVLVEQKAPSPL
jgi:uncharacterized protein YndB with AHSA1/START domain